MSARTTNRLCAALTLALTTLSCTAAEDVTAGGIRYGVAPALDCRSIAQFAVKGNWIEANGVSAEFTGTSRLILGFGNPVATDTVLATMNGAGARDLTLVEVQDTNGVWHKVWEGQTLPPAPGFEQSCTEHRLPQRQVVQALRFGFRAGQGRIEVNHAALLRR